MHYIPKPYSVLSIAWNDLPDDTHAIISLSVCICFFLCIKRLIDVFSLNLEQERNILASLYQEKEKREIINNDEKEINKLKENIRKELKQETEKKETA